MLLKKMAGKHFFNAFILILRKHVFNVDILQVGTSRKQDRVYNLYKWAIQVC